MADIDGIRVSINGGISKDGTQLLKSTSSTGIVDDGLRGPQGPMGQMGPRGEKGDKGEVGPVGPVGPQGPIGSAGPQGIQGERGMAGDAGTALLSGTGIPDITTGKTGDFYINVVTSMLYGPRGPVSDMPGPDGQLANPWPAPVYLIGPEGPRGPQGAAGPKGDKGDKGDAGPQGEVGPAGSATGIVGPQGEAGPAGPKGDQGEKGDRGDIGPQGEAGPAGPAGPAGETGPAGPAGEAGPKGDQGAAGETPWFIAASTMISVPSLLAFEVQSVATVPAPGAIPGDIVQINFAVFNGQVATYRIFGLVTAPDAVEIMVQNVSNANVAATTGPGFQASYLIAHVAMPT